VLKFRIYKNHNFLLTKAIFSALSAQRQFSLVNFLQSN